MKGLFFNNNSPPISKKRYLHFFIVYKSVKEACEKHPEVDVMVNFASLRSAYDVTIETIQFPQFRTIAIIAEGIPENMTRILNKKAKEKGVVVSDSISREKTYLILSRYNFLKKFLGHWSCHGWWNKTRMFSYW